MSSIAYRWPEQTYFSLLHYETDYISAGIDFIFVVVTTILLCTIADLGISVFFILAIEIYRTTRKLNTF